jgi:hypothetical protein
VHALGVCASAGYTAVNAATDPRVRSLALIAPWLHDADIAAEIYGGPRRGRRPRRRGEQARRRYESTGDVDYVPAVSGTDPDAAIPYDVDFYLNPARGGIPAWPNRFAVMSWPLWLRFDPSRSAHVAQPVLVVHSDDAAIPDGVRRVHRRASAARPRRLDRRHPVRLLRQPHPRRPSRRLRRRALLGNS